MPGQATAQCPKVSQVTANGGPKERNLPSSWSASTDCHYHEAATTATPDAHGWISSKPRSTNTHIPNNTSSLQLTTTFHQFLPQGSTKHFVLMPVGPGAINCPRPWPCVNSHLSPVHHEFSLPIRSISTSRRRQTACPALPSIQRLGRSAGIVLGQPCSLVRA